MLIEGAGGLMVPMMDDVKGGLMIDYIASQKLSCDFGKLWQAWQH